MFNLVFLAASLLGSPVEPAESAYFEINVEARTHYTLYVNGKQIESDTCYKTEPLTETVCIEVEIRYVCGEEVISKKMFMDIEPGYKHRLKISISAKPSYVWC